MSRFSRNKQSDNGVSAIVGVLVLVLLVLVLSAGVLFTASNMLGEQPTDMTAGTTTERITDYEYETQLVSQGNAQTVEVVSPLGTHYKLNQVGDATRILAVAPNGNQSQVRDMQIIGLESKANRQVDDEDAIEENSEQQVLERKPVKNGIESDVIVDKYGTGDYTSIQTAIDNVDTAVTHPITEDNPAVIVVERAVYKENLDVSQNISLIAEHGTVIEDSEPNENVVDIQGENVEFRNFDINADPVPNDNHYGLHGINVEGESAEIVGNHIYNASSPDLTSAGLNIDGTATILKFNSVEGNQRSLQFDDNARYPFVCGNQLENTISGQLSQRNINEVTKDNYWKDGVPVALIPEEKQGNGTWSDVKQRILESNNKVPVNEIPADLGRAGQPFPGTKLQASDLSGCDLQISFTNTFNQSFNIENLKVEIEGRNTTLDVVARDTVTYETGDGADQRQETTQQVICYCGGNDRWDRNDTFTLDPIEANLSTNPVETAQAVNIIRDGNAQPGDGGGGGGGTPDYDPPDYDCTNVDVSDDVDRVEISGTCFDPKPENDRERKTTETESDDNTVETQTFQIILGKTVEVQLADQVTLSTAVSGAEGEVGYEWSLGDGTNKSGKQVSHLYEDPGTYDVCLYAWDKATGESDYDCTQATVEEGKKNLTKIRQEAKEDLQQRIDEAKEDKVIYLEEGSYDSLDIKVPGLTVIGNGDVNIQQHASITAEDVTVKNIDFQNGLSVYQDGFKLWNSEAYNNDGYAMEVDADNNKFLYIGNSKLHGQNGLYINTDADATIQNNDINASDSYGLRLGNRMDGIRVTENTITSGDYGIYRGHATTMSLENNDITAPIPVYRMPNQPPQISNINADVTLAYLPTSFGADIQEPNGDRVSSVEWSLAGESTVTGASGAFVTTVDETGEQTLEIQATDKFGASNTVTENFTFEQPSISLQSPALVSANDDVTVSVDTNVPSYRIYSVSYDWGDGSSIKTGSLSRTTSYSSTGNYTATVTLQTDSGFTVSEETQINVTDSPVANYYASPSGERFYVGESIEFNASPSTAPDGRSLSYEWDFDNDGVVDAVGKQVSYTYDGFGEQRPTLTVKDSSGFTDSVTKRVRLAEVNMSVSASNTGVNVPTELSVETSLDSAIDEYRVSWGPVNKRYSEEPVTHMYSSKGVYDVLVEVDINGYNTVVEKSISIQDSPEFNISQSKESIKVGETVDFSVVNVDAESPVYKWEFGDGTTATGKSVSHTFTNAGDYSVSLTVTNEDGIYRVKETGLSVGTDIVYNWNLANVVDSSGLVDPSENPPSNSVDGSSSFVMLDASQEGWIEYNSPQGWKEMRFYSTVSGEVDVVLENGVVLKENWNSNNGWNVVNLTDATNGDIVTTDKIVRIRAAGGTDKRINEVEFKTQSFNFDVSHTPEKPVAGDKITFKLTNMSYVSGETYSWDFNNDGTVDATGSQASKTFTEPGVYEVSITIDTSYRGEKTKTKTVGVTEKETGLYSSSFEDDLNDWNRLTYDDAINEFRISDTVSVEGDSSMFMRMTNSHDKRERTLATNTVFENGKQPGRFVFYWFESQCSHTGGVKLLNSAGNEEVGFSTNNPQWRLHDTNGMQRIYGGDGYRRWIKVEMVFDWDANSYTYTVTDLQSEHTETGTRSLKSGTDIRTIEIFHAQDSGWDTYMWFDNMKFTSKGETEDITSTKTYSSRKYC